MIVDDKVPRLMRMKKRYVGDVWLLLTHITFKIEAAGRQVETLSIEAKTIEFIS